jgi:hypothetical protein
MAPINNGMAVPSPARRTLDGFWEGPRIADDRRSTIRRSPQINIILRFASEAGYGAPRYPSPVAKPLDLISSSLLLYQEDQAVEIEFFESPWKCAFILLFLWAVSWGF